MTQEEYLAGYWLGTLSMGLAIAHSWLKSGQSTQALLVLDEVLRQFSESPLMDDGLKSQLGEYWIGESDDDDDSHVLRPVRA